MYVPTQFVERRPEILIGAIREVQLAVLVTASSDDYHATHIPMIMKETDGTRVLEGHVARQNPHWEALVSDPKASIAIFQGPHAYVTPSWYETKQLHGKVVPTWNYIAVHAHGVLEAIEDPAWLRGHLEELTGTNESHRDQPWALDDAPGDFITNLTRAIVGLRLNIDRLEGSWKLIQHRSEGDIQGTIAGLSASRIPAENAVADAMRKKLAAREKADGQWPLRRMLLPAGSWHRTKLLSPKLVPI